MNNILIVVDMQNDFIDGSLGTKEAQAIVPKVVDRINKAKEEHWRIYYTQDTHYNDYLDTQEGKKLPVKHCIYGTDGYSLNNEVSNAMNCYEDLHKYTKNTFGCIDLAEDLCFEAQDDGTEHLMNIELIGLCTDICVVSNALLLKAFIPEATVSVNAACCAGVTPEKHEAALKTMESCQINII